MGRDIDDEANTTNYGCAERAMTPDENIERLSLLVHSARRELDSARDYLRRWDDIHANVEAAEKRLLSAVLARQK